MKGSGGNVIVACHHVRPPGPVPGRQGVGPLVGGDQSHSYASGSARGLTGLRDPRGLDLTRGVRELRATPQRESALIPALPQIQEKPIFSLVKLGQGSSVLVTTESV